MVENIAATHAIDDAAPSPKEFISFVDASEERGGCQYRVLPNGIQQVAGLVGEEAGNWAEAP